MKRPSMVLGVLLLAPFILAPPLGFQCNGCGPVELLPHVAKWEVGEHAIVDAGFGDVLTRAYRVEISVAQPPGSFEDYQLALRIITSPPEMNCNSCGRACFDAYEHQSCPCVDGNNNNLFMSTTIDEAADAGLVVKRSCAEKYPCSTGNITACAHPAYELVSPLSGPLVSCQLAQGTCVMTQTVRFTRFQGVDDYTVALRDGSYVRQPIPDAGWAAAVDFHAVIEGPVVRVDCEGCQVPTAPAGLSVHLTATEVP
jgi:hypothetical protein